MKRMTLLTALALVFSLFTVTAAIAGPGQDSGEGMQTPNPVMKQDRDSVPDATCKAGDAGAECGEQTRTQAQAQAQAQAQEKAQVGECKADDCQGEEALMEREQIRERVMNQILEMLGDQSATVEGQYRLILNLMLQNMFRFGAMFI